MLQVLAQVIPIVLLVSLGKYLNKTGFLHQNTVNQLKGLIVNYCLSATLLITFLNMEIKKEYLLVFGLVFVFMIVLFIAGFVLYTFKPLRHPMIPFLTSGFAFGFLGIPLFATVFGIENTGKLSIIGIGHEFFIWLVFYAYLKMKFKNEKLALRAIVEILTSPLILSILLGLFLNLAGLGEVIQNQLVLKGLYRTLEYLASMGTPLILIIIGYGLELKAKYMKQSVLFLVIRGIIVAVFGVAFKLLVLDRLIPFDPLFNHAYVTFLLLPPPLSLPIFVSAYGGEEHEGLINNTIMLSTLVCIVLFILYLGLFAA